MPLPGLLADEHGAANLRNLRPDYNRATRRLPDGEKTERLTRIIPQKMGFEQAYGVGGQAYPRKSPRTRRSA